MKTVYFIELDLDEEQDIKEILKEYDPKVQIRATRFKTFEDYDTYRYYNEILGV